jgi:hypothetical protein
MSDAQVPAIDVLRKLFEDVDDDHVFDFPDDIMRAEDLKGLIATVVAGEAALTKRVIEAEAIKRAMGDRAKVVRVSQNGTPIGEPFEAPVDWVPEDQRAVDVTKAVLEVLPVEVPEGGLLHGSGRRPPTWAATCRGFPRWMTASSTRTTCAKHSGSQVEKRSNSGCATAEPTSS